MVSLGKKIRYYRTKMKFTQEELAQGICHTTYISKMENDEIEPPTETLIDLCKRLNITLDQLSQRIDEDKWLLLDNWMEQINEKKINDAEALYARISLEFQEVDNPFLLSHYYITLLYYYILMKDKMKATEIQYKVKDYEKYVTSETEHKISLGLYEYHYGNLYNAYDYFSRVEQIIEDSGAMEKELLYYMALTLSRINKTALSTIYVYRALEAYNRGMNFERVTDCNLVLGINFNLMDEYNMAEEYFFKVIKATDDFHEKGKLAKGKAYHNLGNIYSKQGQSKKSIDMLQKSLQLKYQTYTKINTIYLLAGEYFAIGNMERGKDYLSEGMQLVKEVNDSDYQLKFNILYFQNIGNTNSPEYHDLLKRAIDYFKNTDVDFSCKVAELLAAIYAEKFLYKKAYRYLKLASNLRKKMNKNRKGV